MVLGGQKSPVVTICHLSTHLNHTLLKVKSLGWLRQRLTMQRGPRWQALNPKASCGVGGPLAAKAENPRRRFGWEALNPQQDPPQAFGGDEIVGLC